jgi:hypothetical protein
MGIARGQRTGIEQKTSVGLTAIALDLEPAVAAV